MTRYIAFLRAINVGHGRTLTMESLRKALKPLEFSEVETFIGSGNVIFESRERAPRSLEARIEERLQKAFGYQVETFIRTETELARLAVYQPFGAEAMQPDDEINIVFLSAEPDPQVVQNVTALTTENDTFFVHEREVYWLRRRRPGAAAYSTIALERTLQQPFTIRNMRTIKRLAEKYSLAYQSLLSM
jgi:uncharacterized protein (DUF1697 family)